MSLSDKMARAAEAARIANDASVEATILIRKFNEFLQINNIGVELWLDKPMSDGVHFLGYARVNTTFTIAYRSKLMGDGVRYYGTAESIMQSPREIRLLALPQLAALIDGVLTALQREERAAEEAGGFSQNLMLALTELKKKG